jgi:hypothetical protein
VKKHFIHASLQRSDSQVLRRKATVFGGIRVVPALKGRAKIKPPLRGEDQELTRSPRGRFFGKGSEKNLPNDREIHPLACDLIFLVSQRVSHNYLQHIIARR